MAYCASCCHFDYILVRGIYGIYMYICVYMYVCMYVCIYICSYSRSIEAWNKSVWNFLLETDMKICLSYTLFVMDSLLVALHEDLLHVCAHDQSHACCVQTQIVEVHTVHTHTHTHTHTHNTGILLVYVTL